MRVTATNICSALEFDIGVCRLWPSEKLPRGDPRWPQHTRSFVRERHTVESLVEAIARQGYSITPVMHNDYRLSANFVSGQHFGLDFDSETRESSLEALSEDPFISEYGALLHETISSTPEKPRSRVVFVLDSPITDPAEYCLAASALLWKFSLADPSTKDAARFYYGGKDARHVVLGNVLYRDILQTEVIEPYLQAQKVRTSGNGPASNPLPSGPGRQALDFVANGAPIGEQRMRAVSAARSYLNAGYSMDDTAKALWRGFQTCAQEPGKPPWTFEDAEFIARDIERHPLPVTLPSNTNGHHMGINSYSHKAME